MSPFVENYVAKFKVALYNGALDMPPAHRVIGLFFTPAGEASNVLFRGPSEEIVRGKIKAFLEEQGRLAEEAAGKIDGRTKEGKALLKAQREGQVAA